MKTIKQNYEIHHYLFGLFSDGAPLKINFEPGRKPFDSGSNFGTGVFFPFTPNIS